MFLACAFFGRYDFLCHPPALSQPIWRMLFCCVEGGGCTCSRAFPASVILTAGPTSPAHRGGNRSHVVYLHPLLKFTFRFAFVLWIGFVHRPNPARIDDNCSFWHAAGRIYIRLLCAPFKNRFFRFGFPRCLFFLFQVLVSLFLWGIFLFHLR